MAKRAIKLVQGDENVAVYFTLTDRDSGEAIDVSSSTVTLYYKAAGADTLTATVSCAFVNTGSDGKCIVTLPAACMAEEGTYEGEVEVQTGSSKQTMYDTLLFTVRKQLQV